MKVCTNPDCLSYQQRRVFYDTDAVCPRCGEVLVDPNLAAGEPAPYPAYAATAPSPVVPASAPRVTSEMAMLGAAGTLVLAFLIVAVLVTMGLGHRNAGAPGALPTYVPPGLNTPLPTLPSTQLGPAGTATAIALATLAAQPTPVGGLVLPPTATPTGLNTSGLPTLPPPLGGGATPALPPPPSGAGATVVVQTCARIEAGQPCAVVTTYKPSDTFYLAVEATFGTNAAQAVRVRLYGPPNGETQLLNQDQRNTPDRDGRFWVGFAFSPTAPWQPGTYRADVYLDSATTRAATMTWTVQ